MERDNRIIIALRGIASLVLVLLLEFYLCSCSNDTNAHGPFKVGKIHFETLSEAVSFLQNNSEGTLNTIILTRDTKDSGAVIKGIHGPVIIDLQTFTYTLTNEGSYIVIDNENNQVSIIGGTILVENTKNGMGEGNYYKSLITVKSNLDLINTEINVLDVNAIRVSSGVLNLIGRTRLNALNESCFLSAEQTSKVYVNSEEVLLSGGMSISDRAEVNLGKATLNLSKPPIIDGTDVVVNMDECTIIVAKPIIMEQPTSLNIVPFNESMVLSVKAMISPNDNLAFQWFDENNNPIVGETSPELLCGPYDEKGIYRYYCKVKRIISISGHELSSNECCSDVASVAFTGLPTVLINTSNGNNPTTAKEKNIGTIRIVYDNNSIFDSNDYSGEFSIKVRGNATAYYPKHPYKLKLSKDMKINLLDINSTDNIDRDWVLLANYCDKTLLRNQIGFYTYSLFNNVEGNEQLYVPHSSFVDLILNGEYLGTYTLADSVKEGENRLNDNEKNKQTGGIGFFAEYDLNYYVNEPKWFLSAVNAYPYTFKFPDTDDGNFDIYMGNFEDYINSFETALYDDNSDDWKNYIDIESFARWFLTHNILANKDTNYFLSKKTSDDSSKLVMGPVWDFEWSMGIGWYDGLRPMAPDFWCVNNWYFSKLLEKSEFVDEVKKQWDLLNAVYPNLVDTITNKMDEYAEQIMISQEMNFLVWDILNTRVSVGGIPLGSFEAELECDKQFMINRIAWLDTAISNL